jgi:hypothetical protein
LEQLIATPNLIVDVRPLDKREFLATYGVSEEQMTTLASEGYVVPNIYNYKREGWRHYAKREELVRLLAEYGRTNTEWIAGFLHKFFDFDTIVKRHTQFFEALPLTGMEKQEVLSADHNKADSWDTFAAVAGQRLAYVDTLARSVYPTLVDEIKARFAQGPSRLLAISLLSAAYQLEARDVTASYGGVVPYTEDQLTAMRGLMTRLSEKNAKHRTSKMREVLPATALQFSTDLLNRAKSLRLPTLVPATSASATKLTKADFKTYREVLASVRDGRVGRLLREMTLALTSPVDAAPVLAEYRDLARELDGRLRKLGPFTKAIDRTGCLLTKVDESSPQGEVSHYFFIGHSLRILSGALSSRSAPIIFRGGRPRRLYVTWKSVKQAWDFAEY